jgi:hypothetical protein
MYEHRLEREASVPRGGTSVLLGEICGQAAA